jgi:hypothetical protein
MLTAGLYLLPQRAGTVRVQPASEGYLCDGNTCADANIPAVWEFDFATPEDTDPDTDLMSGSEFHCAPCGERCAAEYGLREASDV